MSFHEVQFPPKISYGSSGGPMRRTEIVTLANSFEHRNSSWKNSRRQYNIAVGIKKLNHLNRVLEFWEARSGPLYGFRYKDWMDYKSCPPQDAIDPEDQNIGSGDGSKTSFQLTKQYASGPSSYVRNINKPVSGTVRVALNGTEQLSGWAVDTSTGVVTFGTAPGAGVAVTAGFEFDVPVRFESDTLDANLSNFEAGQYQSILLVEVRLS